MTPFTIDITKLLELAFDYILEQVKKHGYIKIPFIVTIYLKEARKGDIINSFGKGKRTKPKHKYRLVCKWHEAFKKRLNQV